ncbi:type-F conjugative transfer system protein TraW [Vibrio sp. OPT18]|uniref:type-F conjugative transfer system protein TraW n=1 Tax=Vibrio sp. OPT18 TaxID=2778641 RepID=UPI00188092F8|nr:type-F conjugative transfer system protein TraW [Vibrio sp. OPT18]MBE8574099.1 type-F conjugative transfer system protein TraW [Vibrio sp. OPT18]
MKPAALLLTVTLGSFLSSPLYAKHLGVIGQTFEIVEMDMLDWIQARLAQLEANGEMAKMEDQFKEQVKRSVQRPAPVEGLSTTTSPTTYFVDPSLTLAEDIRNEKGEVLFAKGLTINPFDSSTWPSNVPLPPMALSKQLAFLDGDDERQIAWAKAYRAEHPGVTVKWILTNGEPEAVFKALGERIYFDQQGNITRKLTIKHIPTLAKQEGKQWMMQEFDVSGMN